MIRKSGIMVLGLALVMVLAIACGNTDDDNGTAAAAPSGDTPAVTAGAPASETVGRATPAGQTGAPVTYVQPVSSQTGIWVTGEGTVTLEPDMAVLNIGVETEARTVSAARDEAATAMAAIVAAVKAHGLADVDIQTTSFNVWPRYDYFERTQVLAGYQVSNSVSIKIRDLDKVGEIIDGVTDSGKDATRINGISFTVEDPTPFMAQLRAAAVQNALDKAQHYASLTGVSLAGLVYLAESGGISAPTAVARGGFATAEKFAAPPTSISGGELMLRLVVQVMFGIQ